MPLQTAIILAGGFGTRLQSAVPDLPKCLAPINGSAFIDYVVEYLRQQGIQQFVFALGYKANAIENHLKNSGLANLHFSTEEKPLGTGGAIKKALAFTKQENVLVLNGDTFFAVNTKAAFNLHAQAAAECTLVLKPMANFNRFGTVTIDNNHLITGFHEKKVTVSGLINGGVYLLNVQKWLQHSWPEVFSFETGYLQQHYGSNNMLGVVQDEYFIDIGIPADYQRAQRELPSLSAFEKLATQSKTNQS